MKSFLYLGIVLLVLSVAACDKESFDPTNETADFSPEERFDLMKKPAILFQFAQRSLETGEEQGWIIDRDGWLRTYASTSSPNTSFAVNNRTASETELEALLESASAGVFQLQKAELLEQLYQSRKLEQQNLSDVTANLDEKHTSGFFAFAWRTIHIETHDGVEGCYTGGTGSYTTTNNSYTQLQQLIVDLTGQQARHETSEAGRTLNSWLKNLNAKVSLSGDE